MDKKIAIIGFNEAESIAAAYEDMLEKKAGALGLTVGELKQRMSDLEIKQRPVLKLPIIHKVKSLNPQKDSNNRAARRARQRELQKRKKRGW